ncbi:MAG: hypothetical protein ABEJ02_02955 [Candidatus Paceibacteria bacterium]
MSPDVIFQTEQSDVYEADSVSIQILDELQQYLNDSQQTVLKDLITYKEEKGRWPTSRELGEYSTLSSRTVQPRLTKYLREKMLVTPAGKRECSQAGHNMEVNTWKTTFEVTE